MDIQSTEAIKYRGVEISRKGVTQMAGARVVHFFPRDDIRELRLRHGFSSAWHWLQLAMGTILLGWAALQILDLVTWLVGGGTRYTTNILILFPLLGVGGWLVWDATHPHWYIEMQMQEKTRKLAFDGKIDKAQLRLFLQIARQLGYPLDSTLLDLKDQE